jgi:hypothetical protein
MDWMPCLVNEMHVLIILFASMTLTKQASEELQQMFVLIPAMEKRVLRLQLLERFFTLV